MAVDLHLLKLELANDPSALGLAAMTDQAAMDALNQVRLGVPFQIFSAPVTAAVFFSKLDATEFLALTQLKLVQLQCVFLSAPIDLSDPSVQAILLGIFGAAPTSKANVQGLVKRQASRAEVVLGRGAVVTAADVNNARQGAW